MTVWHMSGAGNDFLVMDARGQSPDFSMLAKKLCTQTGADGFIALDHSATADFKLHFYNPDGSRGEMCGNGARCICRFAFDLGIVGETMTVETDAGPIFGWRLDRETYRIRLNTPGIADLHRLPDAAYVELGDPGIPHAVVELPSLSWEDRESLRGRAVALRHSPAFPKGANINFFTCLDNRTIRILTYERGVEEYTLACGTGCGSVAAVLWMQGRLPGGVLTAHNPGGILTITISGNAGEITTLLLEGPTQILNQFDT